jgi:two-component system, chemotaxis family, protein-glutamate methylesterase/glutaminase
MIRVLVAEDSPAAKALLVHVLESEADISVIATAADGREAVALVQSTRPDVVTMDIHMPRMGGLEATRTIISRTPVPIVIISASMDPSQVEDAFVALGCGALSLCEKPKGMDHPDFSKLAKRIVQSVRLAAGITVRPRAGLRPAVETGTAPALADAPDPTVPPRLVVIGASTGGPPVLRTILSELGGGFPVPVLIVQHIAAGFEGGLVAWLANTCRLDVVLAADGVRALPGCAYVACEGRHMEVERTGTIRLRQGESVNGVCPSVSVLFRSAADSFGSSTVGILLTGMGCDGARELKVLKDAGALTIAQDRGSSVTYGMPGEAIRLGAARQVLRPEEIARFLGRLGEKNRV